MAERSKRINLYNPEKMAQVNPETMMLLNKYGIDMELRELSEKTIMSYKSDLNQWVIYILDNQQKGYIPTVEEATEVFKYCPNCGAKMAESEGV